MAYHRINGNMEQILLQHLRGLADNDGYVTFSARAFALDRGVSYTTIQKVINRLYGQGKLEYTNMGKKGTLVHILKSEQPKDNLRKCPKCGELVEVFVKMGGAIGETGTLTSDEICTCGYVLPAGSYETDYEQ